MPRKVVSREEWLVARKEHFPKEKELTHKLDTLRAERRALPWVKIEKSYVFEGPQGKCTLSDLFQGKHQLAIYNFMLTPGDDHVCKGCSYFSEHVDSARKIFERGDLTFTAISRAPLEQIEKVKKTLDWTFPWVSSNKTDFNYDFDVSFKPEDMKAGRASYNYGTIPVDESEDLFGISIFYKNKKGEIFHTYSTYSRGVEMVLNSLMWLDMTPKGRDETEIDDGESPIS